MRTLTKEQLDKIVEASKLMESPVEKYLQLAAYNEQGRYYPDSFFEINDVEDIPNRPDLIGLCGLAISTDNSYIALQEMSFDRGVKYGDFVFRLERKDLITDKTIDGHVKEIHSRIISAVKRYINAS